MWLPLTVLVAETDAIGSYGCGDSNDAADVHAFGQFGIDGRYALFDGARSSAA